MHLARWQRHGDPMAEVQTFAMVHSPECAIDDCESPYLAKGYCRKHYERWRNHDDPLMMLPQRTNGFQPGHKRGVGHRPAATAFKPGTRGPETTQWKGDSVGYEAVHDRMRAYLGKASNYVCVDCGKQARDWSYNHTDPNETVAVNKSGVLAAYSFDSAHYSPRCKSCHNAFDKGRE